METPTSRVTSFLRKSLLRLVLAVWGILVVYPLAWNVIASLKTNTEILENPWSLPRHLTLVNYVNAFTRARMGAFAVNTVIVTALSLCILLVLAVPTAYAISRFRFPGNRALHTLYLAGLFIQPIFILVPLFLLMNRLHMDDNRFWISVVYAAGQLPFSIYLLIGFLKGIPKDFEQSAMIDGCGHYRTLLSIIVPLSRPGIVTVCIFSFFGFWNEYAMALTLLSTETKKTLSIGLANLMEIQRYATDWGALFAGLVIVLAPTVLLYTFTQKRLTEGLQMGGLKG
jgi:N-acetylglucosamine transport system permease protein